MMVPRIYLDDDVYAEITELPNGRKYILLVNIDEGSQIMLSANELAALVDFARTEMGFTEAKTDGP